MGRADAAFALGAAAWAGYIVGVSFVATPAKFLAPSLSLPVALEVGRATFRVGSYAEAAFALALVGAGLTAFGLGPKTVAALTVVGILLAQHAWLLPILDARVDAIVAGTTVRGSWHHLAWIAADATRLLLLIGLCIATLRDLVPAAKALP